MNSSRRAYLAAGVTGAVGLSAGCLDFILGDGPLEFEAEQVQPTDAALSETNFAEYEVTEETMEESVEEAGIEREVRASYWISAYTREVDVRGETEEAGAFAAVSTPEVSVADQSFNPITEMDSEEILEEYGDQFGDDRDLGDVEHDGTTTLTVLGEERDIDIFVGEREYQEEPVQVDILMTSFGHEDDYLVLIGAYPQSDSLREAVIAVHASDGEGESAIEAELDETLPEDLRGDVEALFESVEHPA